MDNNKIPPLEPEDSLPEFLPDIPEQMEPLDDVPAIRELTFEEIPSATPEPEDVSNMPTEETAVSDTADEMVLEEIPFIPEETEEPLVPEQESAHETDLPEAMSDQQEGDILTVPEVHPEIMADDQAMDSHGLLEHGQEEPPFDISILDHPELLETPEPVAVEESADQRVILFPHRQRQARFVPAP